jgi:hypothetical protein
MKTADFPSVKEARRCAAKQLSIYRQMMNNPENVMHTPGPWHSQLRMLPPTLTERDREVTLVRRRNVRSVLRAECLDALLKDPTRLIRTPGWQGGEAPAFDVVIDEMAGRDADAMRARLCTIIRLAATQQGDAKLQEMALRFLGDIADSHAEGRS